MSYHFFRGKMAGVASLCSKLLRNDAGVLGEVGWLKLMVTSFGKGKALGICSSTLFLWNMLPIRSLDESTGV
jgi:hypothetical protein